MRPLWNDDDDFLFDVKYIFFATDNNNDIPTDDNNAIPDTYIISIVLILLILFLSPKYNFAVDDVFIVSNSASVNE